MISILNFVVNSVLQSPSYYSIGKVSKKENSPNPLSATSVCFGFVKTNHIAGNGIDKTVFGPNC